MRQCVPNKNDISLFLHLSRHVSAHPVLRLRAKTLETYWMNSLNFTHEYMIVRQCVLNQNDNSCLPIYELSIFG